VAVDELNLARDCLDDLLIGRGGAPIGRVDGIVLELQEGQPPRVTAIEVGAVAQARRFGSHVARLTQWACARWGKLRPNPWRIAWSEVAFDGNDCHVDVDPASAPTRVWERWVVEDLLGGKREDA